MDGLQPIVSRALAALVQAGIINTNSIIIVLAFCLLPDAELNRARLEEEPTSRHFILQGVRQVLRRGYTPFETSQAYGALAEHSSTDSSMAQLEARRAHSMVLTLRSLDRNELLLEFF